MRRANAQNCMYQTIASATAAAFVVSMACVAFIVGKKSAFREARAEAKAENQYMEHIFSKLADLRLYNSNAENKPDTNSEKASS